MIAASLPIGLVLAAPVEGGQPIAPDTDPVVGEVTVRNLGSQRSAYTVYTQEAPDGLPISADWFTFEPSDFELDPGASQVITVRIIPDAGALAIADLAVRRRTRQSSSNKEQAP